MEYEFAVGMESSIFILANNETEARRKLKQTGMRNNACELIGIN